MITDSDVARFQSRGYLVVENLIPDPLLAAVRQEYADLLDRHYADWQDQGLVSPAKSTRKSTMGFWDKLDKAYTGGFDWFQPLDISLPHHDIRADTPMHIGPAVFDLIRNKNTLDLVEKLIGPEITSNPIQHVRIKPPENAVGSDEVRAHIVATDWHQDQGVTLPEADQTTFVTVWVAITDATIENGCLQVADGDYLDMLPHCAKTQVTIPDVFLKPQDTTPVPVKAGGAVIFHPLTPHCSLSNKSDHYRWSFDLRYNVTGQPTGRSQFPEFVVRSKSRPDSVLQDWRVWQKMWEDTKIHLSQTPHIDQHRWGNDAAYCA